MHEVSLVRGVFRTLEGEFSSDEMQRLRQINMKVGALANVEPVLMQNAFGAVKADNPRYADVDLKIDMIPAEIECDHCGQKTVIEDYRFVCSCGRPSRNVIHGMELLIHQVEFFD